MQWYDSPMSYLHPKFSFPVSACDMVVVTYQRSVVFHGTVHKVRDQVRGQNEGVQSNLN